MVRAMTTADDVLALFAAHGGRAYDLLEPISQQAHAAQCAARAAAADAAPPLVLAALLHDVGHLLDPEADAKLHAGIDGGHERDGADWLAQRFPEAVSEPVRLHVAAKRYLVATNPDYAARLSAASTRTLALQGGPMSAAEISAFARHPFGRDALRLRAWDEAAKIVGDPGPDLAGFRALIDDLAIP